MFLSIVDSLGDMAREEQQFLIVRVVGSNSHG